MLFAPILCYILFAVHCQQQFATRKPLRLRRAHLSVHCQHTSPCTVSTPLRTLSAPLSVHCQHPSPWSPLMMLTETLAHSASAPLAFQFRTPWRSQGGCSAVPYRNALASLYGTKQKKRRRKRAAQTPQRAPRILRARQRNTLRENAANSPCKNVHSVL